MLDAARLSPAFAPELEYVLLPASRQWSFLSSSRVREIAGLGGNIDEFVHPAVAE